MAMAYHLVKTYKRAVLRLLPPQLSKQPPSSGASSHALSSSTTSRFHGGSRPCLGFGVGLSSDTHGSLTIPHFSEPGLVFSSAKRFFCSDGGADDVKRNKREQVKDEDEFRAVENDESEEEDGDDVEDDDLHLLLSEKKAPLPKFKDHAEEAAYIGYKVVGNVKAGDFGTFGTPKAFAVVQVGSHQFKISPGDCIYTEKLKFADVNDKLSLEKVMLLGSKTQTVIGRPYISKAYVHAAVEEQVLDAKVLIFKKKRRKNYRRCNGHRQELTRLRILEIWGLGQARSAIV